MSEKILDVSGLSCPQPVVLVLNEIKNGKSNFKILLDSEVSKENVTRILKKNKLEFKVEENEDEFICEVKR